MAIVLDINFLCNKMLDMEIVEELLNEHRVNIESINSIDNWMWDNEKKVQCQEQLRRILDNGQIAIIELKHPLVKDMGLYIEKNRYCYHYNLWMNTEGYPMLDCDKINIGNYKFYEGIFQTIFKIKERVKNAFEVIGIGLETNIYYSSNIIDTILKSQNIMFWILNRHVEITNGLEDYDEKNMAGMKILEKKK